ncbi:outer membrane beta-barrel protein [Hyphomicrobium sp. NDB2Meth4]|uniref:outer membrane protein n=1 Tax=Hyphomicrobium sp. NDB2Meth4 TaxID=1892846 RepID=UPI0009316FB1|nr:outer membrane beta-barrel protein [Hyphomicrobium sp. NDB2Meth4]
MKQIYLAVVAIVAAIATMSSVQAQEAPWRGFYAGLNGGYAWNSANGKFNNATDLSNLTLNGAIVGGQIGYNWQANQFLFGLEFDASTRAGGEDTVTANAGTVNAASISADMNYLSSVRARLGWAINNWLLYGTVGWGFGEFTFKEDMPQVPFSGKVRFNDNGVVFGGGVEWMVAYGVSLRAEYLRYDLTAGSTISADFPTSSSDAHIGFDNVDVARAALNIKLSN